MRYYHAHRVVPERCRGRMTCMRVCPTRAIRVREGKPVVSEELCIDCGTCFSACEENAIEPIIDPIGQVSGYRYQIEVPSTVLYSQFDSNVHPYVIHKAFRQLGFDRVVDVYTSADALAPALAKHLEDYEGRLPLISSYCPSLIRLIQVKYPDLVELIVPVDAPREITAREARLSLQQELGLEADDIGIVYVAPCPAKIVSIQQPAEKATSWFDAAVSVRDVYSALLPVVTDIARDFDPSEVPEDFFFSSGWAMYGSITRVVRKDNWLAVSGMDHVKRVLSDIESSKLRNIDFVEAVTCMLGCIGGPFNVENPYVARINSIEQRSKYEVPAKVDDKEVTRKLKDRFYCLNDPIQPRPPKYFDTDLPTSIKRMRQTRRVYEKLRKIDCGCCGAPTCLAFAEDCARGESEVTDCIFLGGV